MTEKITFTISPDGIIINADGFTNGKCLKELEKINKLLKDHGVDVTSTDQKLKQTAYAPDVTEKSEQRTRI